MRFPFRSPASTISTPLVSPVDSVVFPATDMPRNGGQVVSEKERLIQQDIMHRLVVEPYHTTMVHNHLSRIHSSGRRSAVLDVGTGTAQWATQLANAEPFADVVALAHNWKPYSGMPTPYGNLELSSADFNRPFPWPSNSFDLIQVKGLTRSVKNYCNLVERLARLLRRGGLLVLIENGMSYEPLTGGIAPAPLRQWDASVKMALAARGIDPMMPYRLNECVRSAGIFDPSAYVQQLGIPVAGYIPETSLNIAQAGVIHSRILSAEMHSLLPEMLAYGYRRGDLEMMIDVCLKQLLSPHARYKQSLCALYAVKTS